MSVEFLDLAAQFAGIERDVRRAVDEVMTSQGFILGPTVTRFEEEFARYLGASHAIGVANGSDALFLSLRALDVGPGDAVVTTPFTFFATAGAVSRTGATPVFVDIDPVTFNIATEAVDAYLARCRRSRAAGRPLMDPHRKLRVKALLPVHLYGQPADMDPILAAARTHGLAVVEDAAQAVGTVYRGRTAGTMGALGCFSFYPTKNLSAMGDAGAVTTQDAALAQRVRLLRQHGAPKRYFHDEIGINSRLDAMQAAILSVKLPHLTGWNEGRQSVASMYTRRIDQAGLTRVLHPPVIAPERSHNFHQYVVRVPDRDRVTAHLKSRGIGYGIYYPLPLHLQNCYRSLGYKPGDLPEAERACREVLALPVYPQLPEGSVREVVEALAEALGARGAVHHA